RGYAVDRAESFAGVLGVAVALTPWSPSDPLLAIGAALPAEGTDEQTVHQVATALQGAARQLTTPLAVRGRPPSRTPCCAATRRARAANQGVRDNGAGVLSPPAAPAARGPRPPAGRPRPRRR